MDANTEATLMGRSSVQSNPDNTSQAGSVTAPAQQISDQNSTPAGGKENPASGQVDTGKQTSSQSSQPPPQGQDAAPKDEDIKFLLGFDETPEQKLSRLDREYAASSKEARRLTEVNKKLSEILKEQGLDFALENGVPVGLVANKNYSKNMPELDIQFKNLTEKEQTLAVDDPQKFIELVKERAAKAFTRAFPTMDKMITPVSAEREETAISHLANVTWESGEKKYPDFEGNLRLMKQMLLAPNASKALKEFYYQEPEMAMEFLFHRINAARNYVAERVRKANAEKTKKEQESLQTPSNVPHGGGTPAITGQQTDDIGTRIAKAGFGY